MRAELVVGLVCGALSASALPAQQEPRGFLRLEAGRAEIHRASSTGGVLGLRVGRRADRHGIARLELGASYSGADEGYLTLEFGAELRPLARARITPVVGIGAGLLAEPEFGGSVLRGTLGLELELTPRSAIRVAGQRGEHGGERGPNLLLIGLEIRGRRS